MTVENFNEGISSLLTAKTSPQDLKVPGKHRTKGAWIDSTYGGDIRMLNPRLKDQGSYAMNDDDGVVVLRCDCQNQLVASMPCGQIVTVETRHKHAS